MKMRGYLGLSLFLIISGSLQAGEKSGTFSTTVDTNAKPWTSEKFLNNPADFQFAIVADIHGDVCAGVFKSAVEKLNLLRPEFVMSLGDLIVGPGNDLEDLKANYATFDAIVDGLEAPFFYLPGNHDIGDTATHDYWRERRGADYYHFVYKDVLFLCLNSQDPPKGGGIGQEQIDYMTKALADNADVRWTLVFVHNPFWAADKINPSWLQIEELIKERPHSVFAGHHMVYTSYVRNGRDYIRLATSGGGYNHPGPDFGRFQQIAWITMTDEGPRMANLEIDGIYDKDLQTEEMYKVSNLLAGDGWVSVQEMPLLGAVFEGGSTKVTLKNSGAIPMTVKGSFQPNVLMQPTPEIFEVVVAPESSTDIAVEVEAAAGAPVVDLSPLMLDLFGSYEREGKEPLVRHITKQLAGLSVTPCLRQTSAVTIDGQLREWPHTRVISCHKPAEVEGDAAAYKGAMDSRFKFSTAYDDNFLYISVETLDDKKVMGAAAAPGVQDGFIVDLDVREKAKRSEGLQGDPKGRFTDFLYFEISATQDPDQPIVFEKERLPEGVKVACAESEHGMTAEIAVPLSYVKAQQAGQDWSGFRLNVGQVDTDGAENDRTVAWWKPIWSGDLNYDGSGTFAKQ
jgi:hypothetical protein